MSLDYFPAVSTIDSIQGGEGMMDFFNAVVSKADSTKDIGFLTEMLMN